MLERVSLRLQPQLAHGGGHPFLAGGDAVAPELAVDPAVPVAALAKSSLSATKPRAFRSICALDFLLFT